MRRFVTSDHHFGHANIIRHCGRPFACVREMDETMITNWNSVVQKDDLVYHLGDLFFRCSAGYAKDILYRLNGKIICLLGNHDKILRSKQFVADLLEELHSGFIEIPFQPWTEQRVTLCHYKMQTWNKSHYGAWHCYGHCVDEKTEILTPHGWMNCNNMVEGQSVYSYNPESHSLQIDVVEGIHIYPHYRGYAYSLQNNKGIDMRITNNHQVVYLTRSNQFRKEIADLAFQQSRMKFIRSSIYPQPSIDLTDDLLRLLIYINADGNRQGEGIVRIRVKRPHKISYLRQLLRRIGRGHAEHPQKDKSISFDFPIPEELEHFQFKGLDSQLLRCDTRQFGIVLEAYANSDGSAGPQYGKSTLIYTSKKEEVDKIQHLAFLNGYTSMAYVRTGHGFSQKPSYQITLSPRQNVLSVDIPQRVRKEKIDNELFWCIATKQGNFVARRNGSTYVTGNSHGSQLPCQGISLNVCVDLHGFYPLSEERVAELMAERTAKWKPPFGRKGNR